MARKKKKSRRQTETSASLGQPQQWQIPGAQHVGFVPDGKHLLAAGWEGVQLWNLESQTVVRTYRPRTGTVCWQAVVSADERFVLAGFGDLSLWLWDYATGQKVHKLEGHAGIVTSVALSADGSRALSGNAGDRTMRLWDTQDGRELLCCKTKGSATWHIAMNAAGDRAVSGGGGKLIYLWDLTKAEPLRELAGHTGKVAGVALLPNGRFVSASADKTLRLWDKKGNELQSWTGHKRPLTCVAVSPGKTALTGSYDKTVRIWNLSDGMTLAIAKEPTAAVRSVEFSADGAQIVALDENSNVFWWSY